MQDSPDGMQMSYSSALNRFDGLGDFTSLPSPELLHLFRLESEQRKAAEDGPAAFV
jgi:hypothetical protein